MTYSILEILNVFWVWFYGILSYTLATAVISVFVINSLGKRRIKQIVSFLTNNFI